MVLLHIFSVTLPGITGFNFFYFLYEGPVAEVGTIRGEKLNEPGNGPRPPATTALNGYWLDCRKPKTDGPNSHYRPEDRNVQLMRKEWSRRFLCPKLSRASNHYKKIIQWHGDASFTRHGTPVIYASFLPSGH